MSGTVTSRVADDTSGQLSVLNAFSGCCRPRRRRGGCRRRRRRRRRPSGGGGRRRRRLVLLGARLMAWAYGWATRRAVTMDGHFSL